MPRCVTQPLALPSSLGDVSGSQSGGQDGIRTRGYPELCPPLSEASRGDALPVPQGAHTQLTHGALSTQGTIARRQDSSTKAPQLLPNCFSTPSSSSLTPGIKNELQQSPEVPGSAGKCPRVEALTAGWDKVADPICKNPLLCVWLLSLCLFQGPRQPSRHCRDYWTAPAQSSPPPWACSPSPPQGYPSSTAGGPGGSCHQGQEEPEMLPAPES